MDVYKHFQDQSSIEYKKKKSEKMATEMKCKKTEAQTFVDAPLKSPNSTLLKLILPFTLCVISFFTVISLMFFLMDSTDLKHTQFKLSMSRDYDLMGVQQEDSSLITYIRDVHMKKYARMTSNLLAHAGTPEHLNFTLHHELTPEIAKYMAEILDNKKDCTFVQSLSGSSGPFLTAPWLAETLNWKGFIVEPDPRKYFALRKANARRTGIEIIHACLSPTGYPKEMTVHHEVGIDSVVESDNKVTEGFNSRVKCFPLYSLLLAVKQTRLDVLSLGCQGQELDVLKTIPFNKIAVRVISIHLGQHFEENEEEQSKYMRQIIKFLFGKSFKLQRRMRSNYIFQKISLNETLKGKSL